MRNILLTVMLLLSPAATAQAPYSEREAVPLCQAELAEKVRQPDTMTFHQYEFEAHDNGNASVWQNFTAENSKGDILLFNGYCLLFPDGEIVTEVTEAQEAYGTPI